MGGFGKSGPWSWLIVVNKGEGGVSFSSGVVGIVRTREG